MVCDWKCIDFSRLYHCSTVYQKVWKKVYKKSLYTDDIDFDDMGPDKTKETVVEHLFMLLQKQLILFL